MPTLAVSPTGRRNRIPLAALAVALVAIILAPLHGQQRSDTQTPFKASVELVNVTATVVDRSGRFVPNLTADDFIVYEDDVRQQVSQFTSERVPVSLGIALDTSGSMMGEKIEAARAALNRFLFDLLGRDDEVFLYTFSDQPFLLQDWTRNRQSAGLQLGRIQPHGGTAIYDTLMQAVPLARGGRYAKKALLLISDGNDTSSTARQSDVKSTLRESEVLMYAIGIDGDPDEQLRAPITPPQPRRPPAPRGPFPPTGRRPWWVPEARQIVPRSQWPQVNDQRVNAAALRDLTDDSGGRTEIIRSPMDLAPATASIADELSKQYYLGYVSTNATRDGRWRTIHVEMRNAAYRVRSRGGYYAS